MRNTDIRPTWSFRTQSALGTAVGYDTLQDIHIVRLAPGDGMLEVDFAYEGKESDLRGLEFRVELFRRGSPGRVGAYPAAGGETTVVVRGLTNGEDYELKVTACANGTEGVVSESAVRLARPGVVPGTVVNYIHPEDYTYDFSGRSPASPSITTLPNGRMLVSHDVYWQKGGQNLSKIFESLDGGRTWSFLCYLYPCFWGKLFQHRGSVYMLATRTEYGDLIIGRSDDEGKTWSEPSVILPGGDRDSGGPHKAPMPVVEHRGRLWSAIEYGAWSLGGHDAGVVSASVDADLLDPSSWISSPFLPYDPSWPGAIRGGAAPSVLEGNVVVTPDGKLVNILRYHTKGGEPEHGRAVILEIDDRHPERPLSFGKVIDFYGNLSKFTIQFDSVSGLYWSLVNRVASSNIFQRNILTLVSSPDLERWTICRDILNYHDNGWPEDDKQAGFQYVDWEIHGDDLVFLSRTALNGAFNYHNANYITFHRITDFRKI
ncbi:exo-alpha-sialidase [Paenibacillus antri]|uniref:Exo-alpha-sialidase n=1 Tax=Paenibacillus antri TaxID=2582848 RepID=A0A5R9G813_9BACL|nr:sialidase family protein [Paenibacillus antri]TLS51861.1 exo-alpha-sialidase [Paenibacillus antri]